MGLGAVSGALVAFRGRRWRPGEPSAYSPSLPWVRVGAAPPKGVPTKEDGGKRPVWCLVSCLVPTNQNVATSSSGVGPAGTISVTVIRGPPDLRRTTSPTLNAILLG